MELTKYLEGIALGTLGLMKAPDNVEQEKLMLTNDLEGITRQRISEYDAWYEGNGDKLEDIYRVDNMTTFQEEPYYYKNKRAYFWSRASTEDEIKRTHSGFARDMVDTMVAICGTPVAHVGGGEPMKDAGESPGSDPKFVRKRPMIGGKPAQEVLDSVLEANYFWSGYRNDQMPMTLVEGWGAWKISWDKDMFGDDPVLYYYRANSVRVYRRASRVVGMTFLDWYQDALGRRYLVAETRMMRKGKGEFWTDVFKDVGGNNMLRLEGGEIPAFSGASTKSEWHDMPCLFASPCSFYGDPLHDNPGRSILEGRLDKLDDLDQAMSQASNTVRRSTPMEIFDLSYCERDRNGIPKLPTTFERMYVQVRGRSGNGDGSGGGSPVTVTQPNLQTQMYDEHINTLQRACCSGFLSPCSLGLDIAKRDNADAQREKEKETIFTRNHICREEARVLKGLFNQILMACEWLRDGEITEDDYGVSVEYDEFATDSYEKKMEALSPCLASMSISPEMFVEKIYANSIPEAKRDREIRWIKERISGEGDDDIDSDAPSKEFGGVEDGDMPASPEGKGEGNPLDAITSSMKGGDE